MGTRGWIRVAEGAAVFALSVLSGCGGAGVVAGPTQPAPSEASSGSAEVLGTVLDARTGRPVEGAWIELGDGTRTASDANGRFRLRGLAPGTQGELIAHSDTEGLVGRNLLRPLAPGALEVVVFLRPDPGKGPKDGAGDGR